MKKYMKLQPHLRKKKLSEFAGVLAGKEYDDFEKAALGVRHIKSS